MAPYIPENLPLEAAADTAAVAQVRGHIFVGDQDPGSLAVSRSVVDLMRSKGLSCNFSLQSDLAHDFPPRFTELLTGALSTF